MNKLILILSVFAATLSVTAQDSLKYIERSSRIVQQLNDQRFQEVIDQLDTSMTAKLDSARLGAAWRNLLTRGGPFKGVLDTTYDHRPTYDVVLLHSQFGEKKMDIKTVFGSKGQLKGVFFLPTDTREKYQDPPYYHPELFEETRVQVTNGPIQLKGFLTVPKGKGKVPCVILVHGSGPNDKDETVGATKMFRDLAVGLAANGIACVRYDKRTRTYAAKLAHSKEIITLKEESISDAVAAAQLIKKDPRIDSSRIVFIGHSMGAYILPRIVQEVNWVKGMVMICPQGRPLEDLVVDQAGYILSLDETKAPVDRAETLDSLKRQAAKVKSLTEANRIDSAKIIGLHPAYWLDLKEYDPFKTAKQLKKPLFILYGDRDYQVTNVDAQIWKTNTKGWPETTIKNYPDLNHFMIKGSGKSKPEEYLKAGNVDEKFIKDIAGWIQAAGSLK